MAAQSFPNCQHKCDGQWMLSVGSVTTRPCKCRAQQKMMRVWLILGLTAMVVGAGLWWVKAF